MMLVAASRTARIRTRTIFRTNYNTPKDPDRPYTYPDGATPEPSPHHDIDGAYIETDAEFQDILAECMEYEREWRAHNDAHVLRWIEEQSSRPSIFSQAGDLPLPEDAGAGAPNIRDEDGNELSPMDIDEDAVLAAADLAVVAVTREEARQFVPHARRFFAFLNEMERDEREWQRRLDEGCPPGGRRSRRWVYMNDKDSGPSHRTL